MRGTSTAKGVWSGKEKKETKRGGKEKGVGSAKNALLTWQHVGWDCFLGLALVASSPFRLSGHSLSFCAPLNGEVLITFSCPLFSGVNQLNRGWVCSSQSAKGGTWITSPLCDYVQYVPPTPNWHGVMILDS